ncbi:MAG TPA: hypothetical protein VMI31_15525 [Fimbriimonadaceae bacterium]|nr:hypothetical protein [Fimbriimonadaceae bacterium]
METRKGYLTICSDDGLEVYGEFIDGLWEQENTAGGPNHIISATPSDGTLETFRRLEVDGVDHVTYSFESHGYHYGGHARLLALEPEGAPPLVRIETGEAPQRA